MKTNFKRILSIILAIAVLAVSLPATLIASAEVPKITEAEYPVGDVLWSFDYSNNSDVSAALNWAHGQVKYGWGDGTTSVALADTGAVRLTATAVDGIFYLPEIEGDAKNYIYEVSYKTTSSTSSAGLAINATEAAGATWVAVYTAGTGNAGKAYYRRKGTSTLDQAFYVEKSFTAPALNGTELSTMKIVVLDGYAYAYTDGTLLVLQDGSEGFADSNTTTNINLGFFATSAAIDIYSIKVTAIAEPVVEEIAYWDGSFDGALPTTDADGDGEIEITTPEEFAAVASSSNTFTATIVDTITKTSTTVLSTNKTTSKTTTTPTVTVQEGYEDLLSCAASLSSVTTKGTETEISNTTTEDQTVVVTEQKNTTTVTYRLKYELTKDIWLNDTTQENWKGTAKSWIAPVEDLSTATVFNGIINGNGYVVRGMYINKVYDKTNADRTAITYDNPFTVPDDAVTKAGTVVSVEGTEVQLTDTIYAGLFPVVGEGAGFIGIGVEDSYISLTDNCQPVTVTTKTADGATTTADYTMNRVGTVGALVGVVTGSGNNAVIIDQCYAGDTVELTGGYLGLVGKNSTSAANLVVSNSYATCTGNTFNGSAFSYKVYDSKKDDNVTVEVWNNNSANRFMLVSGGNGSSATVYSAFAKGGMNNNGAVIQNVGSGYINVYCTQWAGGVSVKGGVTITGAGTKNTMPNLNWELFTVTDSYPTLNIFTTHTQARGVDVWDGSTTDSSAADTDNDGYAEVYTAEQLAYAIKNSKSAELMNDIWLNDISVYAKGGFYINNMNRAAKTWFTDVSYDANFNGNGNVVHGVFYNTAPISATSSKSGLIPSLGNERSVIKVGVEDSYIRNNSNYSIGAVVGYFGNNKISIDQCYAGETVYVEGHSGVGGITGGGSNSNGQTKSVTNTYSLATVKGSSAGDGRVGGIVGNYWNANVYTIKYCYTNSAQLVGHASTSTIEGTYATNGSNGCATDVTSANMMGDNALTNMANLNGGDAYITTMGYPILKIFDEDYVEEEEVGQVWNGSIAGSYAGGTGTSTDPYIISKGSQLARAINLFGEDGAYYKLDRDIYLNDVTKSNWKDSALGWFEGGTENDYAAYKGMVVDDRKTGDAGTFNGNIDGNGYHIYGIYYGSDSGSLASGLFPVMSGGSVSNLGLDYIYINTKTGAGAGIAAFTVSLTDTIEVDNTYIGENVLVDVGDGKAAAGFFGYIKGTEKTKYINISNSYALFAQSVLSGQGFKESAFIGETWDSYFKLSNVFSIARPFNPTTEHQRASQFCESGEIITAAIADTYKNVYTTTDVETATEEMEYYDDGAGNIIYAYTNLDASQMRGANVFKTMNINGDNAFVANIGYPSLALFGHTVPDKATMLDGYDVVGKVNVGASIPTTDFYYTVTLTENAIITTKYGTYDITVADGSSAKVEIYHIANFDLVYVDDELLKMVACESSSVNTTVRGADGEVQLLVAAAIFDGVTFDGVQLQLADLLGNTAVGSNGFILNATLTESEAIEALGYPVEYGVLMNISSEIVENATEGLELSFDENGKLAFELTGLSIADKEQFYNNRGYAKITIADGIEYYYYASETEIFSPVYVANTVYKNGTDEQKTAVSAIYGGSDKFVWEGEAESVKFTLISDSHYKEGMYMTSVSDMQAIAERAHQTNSDFILSAGDFSNDFKGSPEFVNAFLQNKYNLPAYDIYGNHELESNDNSMSVVTPLLTNQTDNVVWGTESGKIEDGSIGYYYFEQNGIRFICLDNNYSWNPNHKNGEVVGWEHYLTASSGAPNATTNQGRGFDEGSAAVANTKSSSLGSVQIEWLKGVLYDAAEQGTSCVIVGHDRYASAYATSAAPDAATLRAMFARVNSICGGTVLMCINGHVHTDSHVVEDDILYFDMNTTRNIEWLGSKDKYLTAHYSTDIEAEDADVFDFVSYDINGVPRNLTSDEMEKTTSMETSVVYNSDTKTNTFTYTTGKYLRYVYDESLIGQTDSEGNLLADENGQVYATDYYGVVLKDANGASVYKVERLLASLSMSPNTWFASTPLSAVVTVDSRGNINVEGSGYDGSEGWLYGAVSQRSDDDDGTEPNNYYITGKVTSFTETVGYAK